MGSAQPVLHAESIVFAPRCRVHQKTPLFVGFAQSMGLDTFEASAVASGKIIREVKRWACGNSASASFTVPSLQLAFARSASLQLDRLQFDDAEFARAHVVLSDTSIDHGRSHWRLDVAQTDESGWVVTETRIASAQDTADPK